MRTRASTAVVVGLVMLLFALHGTRAAAEPIPVSGFLWANRAGAQLHQELELSFPDFTIAAVVQSPLTPGFCLSCGDGAAVPFTQTTGTLSGHSTAGPGGSIDADVTGLLSFVGPTDFLNIGANTTQLLTSVVQVSGFLRITQAGHVLFDGPLAGTALASVLYENGVVPGTGARLAGYQFAITGVAATPEPASLLLVASGVAWVASRRRRRP